MPEFLEERLHGGIQYGSSWQEDYLVDVVTTSGGQEYRRLLHPLPVRTFDVTYMMDNVSMWQNLVNIYHRAYGKYAGFRAKCLDEYTSRIDGTSTPTAFDQPMEFISGTSYQLRKYYGTDKAASTLGYPYRNIYKPVSGTVKVAIGPNEVPEGPVMQYSLNTATGVVTFHNLSYNITGITKGTTTTIHITAVSSGMSAGTYIYVSGVSGMTQINNLRLKVLSTSTYTVVVDINSTGFSNWTSGGSVTLVPQAGETVTAGFEFDFPVRFNSVIPVGQNVPIYRDINNIELMELINP